MNGPEKDTHVEKKLKCGESPNEKSGSQKKLQKLHPIFGGKLRSAQVNLKPQPKPTRTILKSNMKPNPRTKPKLSQGKAFNSSILNYLVKSDSKPILNLRRHSEPDPPDKTDPSEDDPSGSVCQPDL